MQKYGCSLWRAMRGSKGSGIYLWRHAGLMMDMHYGTESSAQFGDFLFYIRYIESVSTRRRVVVAGVDVVHEWRGASNSDQYPTSSLLYRFPYYMVASLSLSLSHTTFFQQSRPFLPCPIPPSFNIPAHRRIIKKKKKERKASRREIVAS